MKCNQYCLYMDFESSFPVNIKSFQCTCHFTTHNMNLTVNATSKNIVKLSWEKQHVMNLKQTRHFKTLFFCLQFQLPEWYNGFQYFATLLAYANSAFNPVIYTCFNNNFRRGKEKMLPSFSTESILIKTKSISSWFTYKVSTPTFYFKWCILNANWKQLWFYHH